MLGSTMLRCRLLACTATSIIALAPVPALAQAQTFQFDIPAQSLDGALRAFARATHQQVLFEGTLVRGKRSAGVSGSHSADDALNTILKGSGLEGARTAGGAYVVKLGNGPAAAETATSLGEETQSSASNQAIIVTGTHIRGVQPASPLLSISQADMKAAGQHDLGEVLRSVPQNYNGGQNPGVMQGALAGSQSNLNATGGSSFNLRGLGPDATLTLLDGTRLPYDGQFQATDVTTIPVQAIDRVEILLDGASAIYGSDAVGGVVNVILKQDYDGAEVSARYGAATDGGFQQYQLSGIAGAKWNQGAIMVSVDHSKYGEIRAGDRGYLSYLPADDVWILPRTKQTSGLVTGHENFGRIAEFKLDAFYTKRDEDSRDLSTLTLRQIGELHSKIWGVNPSLSVDLAPGWNVRAYGALGHDEVGNLAQNFSLSTGALASQFSRTTTNKALATGLDLQGRLLELPGGAVRVSAGGGYRKNSLTTFNHITNITEVRASDHSTFEYGELFLPVVGPANDIPFAYRLELSAAARHENYASFGGTTTPKLGAIWAPSKDIELKGSWGKSFKVPTLQQQFQTSQTFIFPPAALGIKSLSLGQTVLLATGGNPSLEPERAKTLSLGAEFHPEFLKPARLTLNWFDVRYVDRIIQPLTPLNQALSNPAFADFVTVSPTVAQVQSIIGDTTQFTNLSGVPFNPANVGAILDNRYANSSKQHIRGVDVGLDYSFDLLTGRLALQGNGSWLTKYDRQLTPTAQTLPGSGILFFQPKFRGRAGGTWHKGEISISSFVNQIAGVFDTNVTPSVRRGSMTTVDVVADLQFRVGSLRGLGLDLSAINLFNERPPFAQPAAANLVNYDTTNYSPIGRVLSLTISKEW